MTRKDWAKMDGYHAAVAQAVRHVDELTKLIRGIESRRKKLRDAGTLRLSVYLAGAGRVHDTGCYVHLPTRIVRDAVLPALRHALAEAKAHLASLPPATCTERRS